MSASEQTSQEKPKAGCLWMGRHLHLKMGIVSFLFVLTMITFIKAKVIGGTFYPQRKNIFKGQKHKQNTSIITGMYNVFILGSSFAVKSIPTHRERGRENRRQQKSERT